MKATKPAMRGPCTRLPVRRTGLPGPLSKFPLILSLGVVVLTSGCGVTATRDERLDRRVDTSKLPDAVPRREPLCRFGNPDYYDVLGKRYYPLKSSTAYVERGLASWYGADFHGKRTSCGEPYDMYQMTAAHRLLPIPTYCEVTNLENGRKLVVKVNDRGPFNEDRLMDLSYAAAQALGIAGPGTGLVEVRAIERPWPASGPPVAPVAPAAPVTTQRRSQDLYLQVGAFSIRDNAERLRDKISAVIQETVQIQRSFGASRPLYKVRIGPLPGAELADRIVERLVRIGLLDHRVVAY